MNLSKLEAWLRKLEERTRKYTEFIRGEPPENPEPKATSIHRGKASEAEEYAESRSPERT